MDRRPFQLKPRERGGTLVLMAVVSVAMLGLAALAVDVGMGFTAKGEAQRIADAAALAGASAFLEYEGADGVAPAEERAYDFALRNVIRNVDVDSSELTIQVVPDESLVRVWVQRESIGTWFARLIGVDEMNILASAAAQATQAGAARCLKPFAVPDLWHDADDDTDGDRVWDEGEEWELGSHPDDRYIPYTGPDGAADATGYGSEWRGPDQDFGAQINLKMPDPQSEYVPAPGIFLPWRIPYDDDQEPCDQGGGGGQDSGGAVYRRNICSCNNSPVELGAEYQIEPGNMIGPTNQGVDELIEDDPNAYWDPTMDGGRGGIRDSDFGDGLSSPRVIKLALFDPSEIEGSGMQTIRFNNFALMFIEEQAGRHDPVVARFMYFVSGEESTGPTTGSLVRYLRLVE
ncbi:MAG: hypothetical protein HKN72_10895 [Gemmatimonadetes bacterium]|nr:hypothetical protein [Gemmatimonadota bacterium]